jgi:hypothetical protein
LSRFPARTSINTGFTIRSLTFPEISKNIDQKLLESKGFRAYEPENYMDESIELIRQMPNLTFLHDTAVSTGIDFIPLALSLSVSMKQPGKRRKLQGTFSAALFFSIQYIKSRIIETA